MLLFNTLRDDVSQMPAVIRHPVAIVDNDYYVALPSSAIADSDSRLGELISNYDVTTRCGIIYSIVSIDNADINDHILLRDDSVMPIT